VIKLLEKMYDEENQLDKQLTKELKRYPKGSLELQRSGKGIRWYWKCPDKEERKKWGKRNKPHLNRTESDRVRLGEGDHAIVIGLRNRRICRSRLKAAKKNNVPVRIAHSHNSNQDKNLKYLVKLYYKRKIKNFSTDLFACGKEAGDWMFSGEKYQVIHNAIDSNLYICNIEQRKKVRIEWNIPEDVFLIGHVGRFNAVKNHSFLLDIFTALKKVKEESMLVLVGDGELREKMEKKAAELGIADSVIFTGVRSDVADIMKAMDCFVFPSLYEGLPVTLIEAQAAGLPCVVSENVSNECDKTGLVERVSLKESKDIWAKCILNQIGFNRQNTNEMIKKAGYDINVNAQQLQNFYLDKWKKEV